MTVGSVERSGVRRADLWASLNWNLRSQHDLPRLKHHHDYPVVQLCICSCQFAPC
jgi:hypothetical protein